MIGIAFEGCLDKAGSGKFTKSFIKPLVHKPFRFLGMVRAMKIIPLDKIMKEDE